MDWANVYNGSALANLTWYGVLGNHDIVTLAGGSAQLSYGQTDPRWVMDRYYAREFVAGSLRVRMSFINTSPMVTKYVRAAAGGCPLNAWLPCYCCCCRRRWLQHKVHVGVWTGSLLADTRSQLQQLTTTRQMPCPCRPVWA